MRVSADIIKSCITGAEYCDITEGKVKPNRFTAAESDFYLFGRFDENTEKYKARAYNFVERTQSSAGVKLAFTTNTRKISCSVKITFKTESRSFFACDVCVDGELVKSVGNIEGITLDRQYSNEAYEVPERVDISLSLKAGDKLVEIYLPWDTESIIESVETDDEAYIKPYKRKKTLVTYGDSITQGYDAVHPSNRYGALLARALDADEICKAIGGEIFVPKLASLCEGAAPDYIVVAYGTNNWSGTVLLNDNLSFCREFYRQITQKRKSSRIIAVSPLWRSDIDELWGKAAFEKMRDEIKLMAEKYENITFVDGLDLVPHDVSFFGDGRLHPNDDAFKLYANGIISRIQ